MAVLRFAGSGEDDKGIVSFLMLHIFYSLSIASITLTVTISLHYACFSVKKIPDE